MPFEILVCGRDEALWDAYFLLLMNRYADLGLPYDFEMTLSFIGNPILVGDALIVRERGTGATVGALGFVFGSGQDDYEDPSICQAEIVYLEQRLRHTKLFAALLTAFAAMLRRDHPQADVIQFWSPDRPDLNRLFAKFSDSVKTSEKDFGRIHLYRTQPDRILSVLSAMSKRMERRLSDGEIKNS